jgi:ATP adenylyltransferase
MDVLWSPWRYDYIKSGDNKSLDLLGSCVFCGLPQNGKSDEENFIIHRAVHNYIVLNIYPYISGHLLIIPYAHTADLDTLNKDISDELMDLAKRSQTILREVYQPQGFNLGMNLGRAAGAGVAEHVHLHFMPRWFGDTNFTSTIGETRVIPEALQATYQKLSEKF